MEEDDLRSSAANVKGNVGKGQGQKPKPPKPVSRPRREKQQATTSEIEMEEEDNSFDMNDDMSEDEMFFPHGEEEEESEHISVKGSGSEEEIQEISGHGDLNRGKKRRMKVKIQNKARGSKAGGNKAGGNKASTGTEKGTSSGRHISEVWNMFEKVEVPSPTEKGVMITKAKCMYCKTLYSYQKGSSTSHLGRHMQKCTVYQKALAKKQDQALLNFAPSKAGEGGSGLPNILASRDFSQEQARKLLAKMIITHEYPFRMVEHTYFNIFTQYLNPAFQHVGRKTARADCMKFFESEKEILKKSLRSVENIVLTTDLWTSNQTISYMCLVAHYIDSNWKMQCRVLSFFELEPPHTGQVIAQAVFDCCQAWKIEDKIISITLDNAGNNDVAVRSLKAKFIARHRQGTAINFMPKYFHVRCCAHIINLVVNDGTDTMKPLITKLRECVKYIKKSPSRMHKFVEVCRTVLVPTGEGLKLDVATRWGSTYKMLSACITYRLALQQYGEEDATIFRWEPANEEWDLFISIKPILAALAKVSTTFSASTYPTSNIFYPYIVDVKVALLAAESSSDLHLNEMGTAMLKKFNKYWEEKNNVMVIATILDPRYKMRYVEWCFGRMFEAPKNEMEIADVRDELEKLYEKYETEHRQRSAAANKSHASSSSTVDTSHSLPTASCEFQSFLSSTSSNISKSELIIYLDEQNEDLGNKDFELLQWWKINSHRFPVVSKMARFFLTISATSVSSESTFSSGGRVLDDFRSSLKPSTVEALICASSWIRGSHEMENTASIFVEGDDEDDVETIQFPKSVVDSN